MQSIYSFFVALLYWVLRLVSFFHPKIKEAFEGRKHTFNLLDQARKRDQNARWVWFHCASLGEFEQARPLIEEWRRQYPDDRVLLSFFSASGYRVRRDYSEADIVTYIPFDLSSHANRWVESLDFKAAFFVKYEFWPNHFAALQKKGVPLYHVAGVFREDQFFFKPYGNFARSILKKVDHFFVQNDQSKELLSSVGIQDVTVVGDPRFDRVRDIADQRRGLSEIENFKSSKKCFIVGSAWPEDIQMLASYLEDNIDEFAVIIAPHEIDDDMIEAIRSLLTLRVGKYSNLTKAESPQVLIIDNVGMLSSLYYYADFAWIGGAYGAGLHNTLEAAIYGVPLFFGDKNYEKFREAVMLIERGAAYSISHPSQIKIQMDKFLQVEAVYDKAAFAAKQYCSENLGAVSKIMAHFDNK
ncbi:MAG: 3-deoxy-D-manno-octulosonic acid transferase [Cyclobacteriaceae bacterium]|nr:3-deoxy-D-manno-octulosonic acid transferase [Cyclobacteriaceae bacterium]MCH8516576.1 3-deoxy-D-manno-octulosonic acid transferase [Cyclobacteriaceae bacterium]